MRRRSLAGCTTAGEHVVDLPQARGRQQHTNALRAQSCEQGSRRAVLRVGGNQEGGKDARVQHAQRTVLCPGGLWRSLAGWSPCMRACTRSRQVPVHVLVAERYRGNARIARASSPKQWMYPCLKTIRARAPLWATAARQTPKALSPAGLLLAAATLPLELGLRLWAAHLARMTSNSSGLQ